MELERDERTETTTSEKEQEARVRVAETESYGQTIWGVNVTGGSVWIQRESCVIVNLLFMEIVDIICD